MVDTTASPYVPNAGSVVVGLLTPPEMVRITVYSKMRPGAALRRDTRFSDMKSFAGGPPAAVAVVTGYLTEQMNLKYGDNFDSETMAKTGINAFLDVMKKVELTGFGKEYIETDEDEGVVMKSQKTLEES